jgi:hypothetical protein
MEIGELSAKSFASELHSALYEIAAPTAGHENDRAWKAWKAMKLASHLSHTPWKSLQDSHYWNGPPLVPQTDYLVRQEASHGDFDTRYRLEQDHLSRHWAERARRECVAQEVFSQAATASHG